MIMGSGPATFTLGPFPPANIDVKILAKRSSDSSPRAKNKNKTASLSHFYTQQHSAQHKGYHFYFLVYDGFCIDLIAEKRHTAFK
jgi:hypothetical protein